MEVGARCQVNNLTTTRYNGQHAIVTGHVTTGRLRVRLDSGPVIDVLPEKLFPLASQVTFPPIEETSSSGTSDSSSVAGLNNDNGSIDSNPSFHPSQKQHPFVEQEQFPTFLQIYEQLVQQQTEEQVKKSACKRVSVEKKSCPVEHTPKASPSISKVVPSHLKPYPPDEHLRRAYRRFLQDRGRTFSCGRQGLWPEDLLAHYTWWRGHRTEEEPEVDWEAIRSFRKRKSKLKGEKRSGDDGILPPESDSESSIDSDAPLASRLPTTPLSTPTPEKRGRGRPKKIVETAQTPVVTTMKKRKLSSSQSIGNSTPTSELKTPRQKSKWADTSLMVAPPSFLPHTAKPPWGLLLLSCHACTLSYHLRCLKLKHFPSDHWRCPECKKALEEDAALALCLGCGFGGELLCCETCPRTYHAQCVDLLKHSVQKFQCAVCRSSVSPPHNATKPVSKLIADVMALCSSAPPSHFLSIFATKLASIQRMEELLKEEEESTKSGSSSTNRTNGGSDNDVNLSENAICEDSLMRELSRRCDRGQKTRICKLCGEYGHMHQDAVTQIHEEGLYLSETGLSPEQLDLCTTEVQQQFDHLIHTVNTLQLQDQLRDVGFDLIKMRHTGRYDIQIPAFSEEKFAFLNTEGPWMPLVREVLGDDCQFKHSGCMLALPGAHTQPEHSDGYHLTESKHLAVHALNVFIPFIDLTAQNGCTEFAPTTHILGNWEKPLERLECHTKAGNWLVFDYRLRHRGLANNSAVSRPLLYLTYAKPSWHDKDNFSATRYPKLPDIPRVLSREERTRRREAAASDPPPPKRAKSHQKTSDEVSGKLLSDSKHSNLTPGGELLSPPPVQEIRTPQESIALAFRHPSLCELDEDDICLAVQAELPGIADVAKR